MRTALSLLLLLTLLPAAVQGQKKKKKKPEVEITQTLEVIPDPPASVTVETAKSNSSPPPFPERVCSPSRFATRSKRSAPRPAPARSSRSAPSSPEPVTSAACNPSSPNVRRKETTPAGRRHHPGRHVAHGRRAGHPRSRRQRQESGEPQRPRLPQRHGRRQQGRPGKTLADVDKAIADLSHAAKAGGSDPADVQRVTCLLSALDSVAEVRTRVARAFPSAVLVAVQAQRLHDTALAECEAVTRLRTRPAEALVMLNPPEMNPSPMYSKGALIGAEKLVLTGTQMAFHSEDKDVHLAFQRMSKVLDAAGSSMNTWPSPASTR